MTKLGGALPKGEGNGLGPIVQQLISVPSQVHVVVALIDCKSTKIDHDTGDLEPTARIRRVEVVLRGDMKLARELLDRSYQKRCGQTVLPYELESDLKAAFGRVDLATGELFPDDDRPAGSDDSRS